VHTTLLTDPAASAPNEDAGGVLGRVAVVLDGAGVPARYRAGCHHSVAWFSHVLAARLLDRAQDPARPLRRALADAIEDVRGLHEGECDLEQGGPSATVVVVRWDEERLEHLVLCDSSLLLELRDGSMRRVTDPRVEQVVAEESGGGSSGEAIEARRNAPGGFWVARHEPEAAAQALVGETSLASLRAGHLVSDGITRTIDDLGDHDVASLSRALREDPRALLRELREAEARREPGQRPRKVHDDATVLTILP